ALKHYLDAPELRIRHGRAARKMVLRDFSQEPIWEALYDEYRRLLSERGLAIYEAASSDGRPASNSTAGEF
ncbi:hypothetical protein ACFL2Q_16610, partial [Thermodesulfobacteriota bacterium]